LRCKCLQRGANGIKGLARLVEFFWQEVLFIYEIQVYSCITGLTYK
jgi:hypothetical protein